MRQTLREEEGSIKEEAVENNNDNKNIDNSDNSVRDEDEDGDDEGLNSFDTSRRMLMTDTRDRVGATGRLAFSVENILAPGGFGAEGEEHKYGEIYSGV